MSRIYCYYISSCTVLAKVISDMRISLYAIQLSNNIKYCSCNNVVRKVNDYDNNIIVSNDDTIHIGVYIGKRRLNRQDPFMTILPVYIKNNIMRFNYEFMYEYYIQDIINIVCNSSNIKHLSTSMDNVVLKMYFLDTVIICDDILLYTMSNKVDFFPRERSSISKPNNAKLVHITSSSEIVLKNSSMESVTLSSLLQIDYMSNCTLAIIKVRNNNSVDEIMLSLCDLITSLYDVTKSYVTKSYPISSMKHMRSLVSDLFVQRFSRESSNEIAIIDAIDVDYYKSIGYSVLMYESRWYIALDKNMFMGLKTNRLPNSTKYLYIPAVYKRDHSKIPGTNAYNYLHDNNVISYKKRKHTSSHNLVRELDPWEVSIAPNCVLNMLSGNERQSCIRIGVPSSIHELLNFNINNNMFVICKQELPHLSCDQIKELWYQSNNWHHVKHLYRILERILNVSVIILDDTRDHTTLLHYSEYYRYMWNPCDSNNMMILLRTRLSEYRLGYEIISYNRESIIISCNTYLYKYALSCKLTSCARYIPICESDVVLQYLNSEGKCVAYLSREGRVVKCFCPPVLADYVDIRSLPSTLSNYLPVSQSDTVSYVSTTTSTNSYGYDNVVIIFNNRYYVSELLDMSYTPQLLIDRKDDVVYVDNEKSVSPYNISILRDGDKYVYYMPF